MRRPVAMRIGVIGALVVGLVTGGVGTGDDRTARAATRYLDATFAVDVQRDVVYGTAIAADGTTVTLLLDLYTPRGDTVSNRPAYIHAHGGFFAFGDKSSAQLWATRMAQRGYVAASINYRLGAAPVLAPIDSEYEVRTVNDARADMQAAVRWFRANSTSLRIDPERIAVGGESAGAVTALGVAINADAPLPGSQPDESSAVCTAVSISGANDPTAIGAGDAGALFLHGALDVVVPYGQAVATRDAMSAAGLPTSFVTFPDEGHSFTSESRAAMIAPTVEWLYERVATAPYPCSPAVARRPMLRAGASTVLSGRAGASAVVSIVGVETSAPGFLQSLPCATTPGEVANVSLDEVGQTRAGLAVAAFGADGRSCLFNLMRTHAVVDLQGWFAPGAFDDVPDERLLDTRPGARPGDGASIVVRGRPNRTAIVMVSATESAAAGFVQLLPCGSAPGAYANLNLDGPAQTRTNLAVVRFDAAGEICVSTQRSAELIVDLQGYLADGAVDDVSDDRLLDTRSGPVPGAGSLVEVRGRPGATGIVSIVATDTTGPGFVQALACGTTPGASANLNVDRAGRIIGNLAFVRFGADGRLCLYTQRAANLVVDLQAYLTPGSFDDVPDARLLDSRVRPG
jgi:acetyl esterase/lipase